MTATVRGCRLDFFDPRACGPRSWVHYISLTEFALDVTDNPQRPLAVNAAAQSEYAAAVRQAHRGAEASDRRPGCRSRSSATSCSGGSTSERWRRMMQRAEAALRPQLNSSSRVAVRCGLAQHGGQSDAQGEARMLAPPARLRPACIKVLRTSSVASPKLSIRD